MFCEVFAGALEPSSSVVVVKEVNQLRIVLQIVVPATSPFIAPATAKKIMSDPKKLQIDEKYT